MTERKQWGGGGGEPESNNLVYTKRLKDMYANRKHETTSILIVNLKVTILNVYNGPRNNLFKYEIGLFLS